MSEPPSDQGPKTPARGPGLAKATRGALRQGEMRALSREAEELLFRHTERMSEGSVRAGPDGDTYFGSTMFTVDLSAVAASWRGELDREQLAALIDGSVRVRVRLMRLACAEAAHRVPGRQFGTAQVETSVEVVGDKLHLDVDLEVPLDVSSAKREA